MVEFDWDEHNSEKVRRHGLQPTHVEDSFYDPDRRFLTVKQADPRERRYGITGRTDDGRVITVIFVRREKKIRVITARDADASERRSYNRNH